MELQTFTVAYLDALRAGDPLIQQHFVSYFSRLLVIKLRARQCAASEIDEISQETFARVLAALRQDGGLRGDAGSFGAFVNGVCNRVYLESLRRARREPAADPDATPEVGQVIDLDARLVTEQDRRRVHAVLRQLAPREQALLRAVFFEEKDKDAICREHGVDREYLRVLVHRAKQHFRALYASSSAGQAVSSAAAGASSGSAAGGAAAARRAGETPGR